MVQDSTKRKCKCKSILLLVLATIVLPVWGGQVDENTARKVATQTLSRRPEAHNADSTTQLRSQAVHQKTVQLLYKSSSSGNRGYAKTTQPSTRANADENVYFYVFGAENNEGFVIVAGDDRITPVLGYSHANRFPADAMPPNLQWWLGEYAKQIQYAIENDIEPTIEVKQQWAEFLDNENNEKED